MWLLLLFDPALSHFAYKAYPVSYVRAYVAVQLNDLHT